jgi:hypothetical protein
MKINVLAEAETGALQFGGPARLTNHDLSFVSLVSLLCVKIDSACAAQPKVSPENRFENRSHLS